MAQLARLRLGALAGGGQLVNRSGFRWLCGDGQPFAAGDVLAYCNIALGGARKPLGALGRVDGEQLDFQVALVAAAAGRLRRLPGGEFGGWQDRQEMFAWKDDDVVAAIEPAGGVDTTAPLARHHFLAGRRACELAEDRSGLMTGWHDRGRAWRQGGPGRAGGPTATVLGLGSCDLFSILRGERGAFLEMLGEAGGPAHVVETPDRPLVHSARVIVEQLARGQTQREALAEVFARAIAQAPARLSPSDWTFLAMSLQALSRSPTAETYEILAPSGVETTGPADTVVLSLVSEPTEHLRHKRLGFSFACHGFRLAWQGQALRDWFREHFDFAPYTIDDVRRDYLEMARLLRRDNPRRQIIVLNRVSTFRGEDIVSYAPFEGALGDTLRGYRARELNAMLDDAAREADIDIVDVDAIAADMGVIVNVPDGAHQNGPMQREVRAELLAALRARHAQFR